MLSILIYTYAYHIPEPQVGLGARRPGTPRLVPRCTYLYTGLTIYSLLTLLVRSWVIGIEATCVRVTKIGTIVILCMFCKYDNG